MRYIRQHIAVIIHLYKGDVPLTHFLKNYFKQHPKLGSRDRKILSEMAYCWYRCEKGIESKELDFDEKMNACLFLCSNNPLITSFLPGAWDPATGKSIAEKMDLLHEHNIFFDVKKLFPGSLAFSDNLQKDDWVLSMLEQPKLFIRIRKKKKEITALLNEKKIIFEFLTDSCLVLPNGAAIDKLLPADAYVVQDASSQKTGQYFHPQKNEHWYDCCSGAGGKSLLLKDLEPAVHLTASDTRESILHNLKDRFTLYHRSQPETFKIDVSDKAQLKKQLGNKQFNAIICDVPCTGSGTWARTPEQLYFFKPEALQAITQIQKAIAVNAASLLQKEGRLIYITCSVFKKENEDVVKDILKETGLYLEELKLINGINIHADSMFIAILRKR